MPKKKKKKKKRDSASQFISLMGSVWHKRKDVREAVGRELGKNSADGGKSCSRSQESRAGARGELQDASRKTEERRTRLLKIAKKGEFRRSRPAESEKKSTQRSNPAGGTAGKMKKGHARAWTSSSWERRQPRPSEKKKKV